MFVNEALPFIKDKRLIGLGVTTPKRSPLAPELPALSEILPGYDVTSWYGVFAPAGTPQPIIDKLAAEIAKMMTDDDVKAKLAVIGATPVGSSPKEFTTYVNAEIKRWGEVIRPMNITLD